jgi:hypothetical protein
LRIRTGKAHPFAVALADMQRELGSRSGLAGALKAGEEDHGRGLVAEIQFRSTGTQGGSELIMENLDEGLTWTEAAKHLLAHRPLAHTLDEFTHHRQGHVGLDEGTADVPDCILDVVFSKPPATANLIQDAAQAV